jgi:hypothetical protein
MKVSGGEGIGGEGVERAQSMRRKMEDGMTKKTRKLGGGGNREKVWRIREKEERWKTVYSLYILPYGREKNERVDVFVKRCI